MPKLQELQARRAGTLVVKTRNGKFRVRYIADNGEILAVSEVLNTRANCRKNIEAMRKMFK